MTDYEIFLLDVSTKRCPMTTVYVRTRLDAMTSGQKLRVLVKGEEPKRNVSSAVRALGHEIIEENNANLDSDRYCMLIIKS
ncbi:hypothetical protein Gbth_019_012 [Gluconobacter thailandicus F149-1 = NBRC 100600]|jgi:TusA-related sulfurtransferase|uniref:Sulfurtransferase TusA family protein n=2 Tax=Gluconobacter thailandicus TaxID=257438 RepID=A0AAP9JGS3_GLUTH|nr:sulfurtransferase TusA family protein [Gluconobacter thailandicus]GAN90280.1 hypothetical protein Gbfr_013_012 [Gluconobacter frateurii M-2]QEH95552.1 sulfurtransferase TusA family protein [Gluconobacter thailandicus]GAN93029.1 hypothetical protein Gbth_019_012 [Gluconobacter thailandicus F149-1 = NBRC 100600]GBR59967.1 hypothetical protein AA100600_1611 [Gluconobacter thailandicus F149-1 = NBRC 100600]GEL86159.1 hypothetical protein GTH01_05170 [Gluconobacter thailandicus F149-1 = NBRC 100